TTKKYKGLNPGRRIELRNENYDFTANLLQEDIEFKSPRIFVNDVTVVYGNEALVYSLQGVSYQFQQIENATMSEGRFINYQDEVNTAKVAVIGNKIAKDVFNQVESPIGEFIDISGIPFKIIGLFGETEDREEERIFIPVTTAQRVFNGADKLNNLAYTLPPVENFDQAVAQAIKFKSSLQSYLQQAHTVAPDDTSAIFVWSAMEEAKRFYGLTDNIKLFFWFVGICTIIAGVVGVSNIMLIVVRERTKEIGIRKALGAKPWSIVGMILHESIFVTAISGFAGLIFSMGLLEVVGPHIEVDYILNPSVNFTVAVSTVFVLILAGAIAGFFPAWRAANIHTIDALRDE
ncbi:MAG: FtsX-like permease family protein, partial [Pricia sp.]|nr:FtsX-like permease family protein [Pricia sp.]